MVGWDTVYILCRRRGIMVGYKRPRNAEESIRRIEELVMSDPRIAQEYT